MSQAEVLRGLKIKTNSLSRLHKELEYYVKEKDKEQARVDRMKADSADPHDIRQAVRKEHTAPETSCIAALMWKAHLVQINASLAVIRYVLTLLVFCRRMC